MQVTRHIGPLKTIAQIIFVAVPTIAIMYFLFWNVTNYYTILNNQFTQQTIFFSIGLLSALLFYAFRFRFITTTPLLFFCLYLVYKSINKYGADFGEFDAFFYTIQFLIFSLLFGAGWLVGWAFQRIRYFHFVISTILLAACIYVIARTGGFDYQRFTLLFIPVILYSVYIIFTTENLQNTENLTFTFWKKFGLRLIGFLSLLFIFLGVIILSLRNQIEASIMDAKGKGNKNATTQVDKDGKTQMNDGMQLSSSNSKNHELLFCAHINNYFDGTNEPNPLYLTSYHYTKFDTLSESFERDSLMPSNDEFTPNLATIPLFSVVTDSSKITKAKSNKMRETIEVEIYNIKLSKNSFVAPSTSYQAQSITVDKNFQEKFTSAYRAKSYVSKLNSAYFIYNVKDPYLEAFQSIRFAELRKVKKYSSVDSAFIKYYTQFPSMGGQYKSIQQLGDSLAKGKNTSIDKVLAVRDYFLKRDALGKQTFSYTDNPGVPGIPNASKVCNFLFVTKKGYCAYYSAATLFLLRSMGIPCRIAAGFLTENRANKNPGWYWFYANQSHAWVEVYFPEYGWIDFDTTVGNDDSRSANQPDGTPPSPPAKAPLAINATVTSIDTSKKTITLAINNIAFKEKVFVANKDNKTIEISKTKIIKDTNVLQLADIHLNDNVVCVAYDNKLNTINGNSVATILQKIKNPLPIDEIYINEKSSAKKDAIKNELETKSLTAKQILLRVLLIIISLLFLFFSIPFITKWILFTRTKSSNNTKQINAVYKYVQFYLHQLGYQRHNATPYQFAQNMDKQFAFNYTPFMNSYLQLKYANNAMPTITTNNTKEFLSLFHQQIKKKVAQKTILQKMFNPITTINYLLHHQ